MKKYLKLRKHTFKNIHKFVYSLTDKPIFNNSSMALSKTRVSNARGSPRGTQMSSPRAAIKLRMPHRRDLQREPMPRGCPGGGDGHCWNWLMHYNEKN